MVDGDGTEFRADHFKSRFRSAVSVSAAGIVVPFVLAFALIPWLLTIPGLFSAKAKPLEAALFLGAAIAITAFPMLARIIHERGLSRSPLGSLSLSAGAIDDAAAWIVLAIVLAPFGGWPPPVGSPAAGTAAGPAPVRDAAEIEGSALSSAS